jgi:cell division protein ZapA
MSDLKININILGREYPITITPEEEDRFKEANRLVEEKVNFFKDTVKINDIQDLLAMVAFDAVVDKLNSRANLKEGNEKSSEQMRSLLHLIKEG